MLGDLRPENNASKPNRNATGWRSFLTMDMQIRRQRSLVVGTCVSHTTEQDELLVKIDPQRACTSVCEKLVGEDLLSQWPQLWIPTMVITRRIVGLLLIPTPALFLPPIIFLSGALYYCAFESCR